MKRFFVALVAAAFVFSLGAGSLPAQKKSPEETFVKMDKNGDKKLSLDEFIGKKTADKGDKAKERFKKLDRNNDGFVTLDEYKGVGGAGKKAGEAGGKRKKKGGD